MQYVQTWESVPQKCDPYLVIKVAVDRPVFWIAMVTNLSDRLA